MISRYSMRRKTWATAALALAAGMALTACSTGASPSAPAGSAAGGKLLGIVSITATDANNARVIVAGATEAAKAAGWTVEVVDAQGNADQANAAIRNFVSKKAGAIFDLVFRQPRWGLAWTRPRRPASLWRPGVGDWVPRL